MAHIDTVRVNINGKPYDLTVRQYRLLRKSYLIRVRKGWYVTPTLYKYVRAYKKDSTKPMFKV